MVEVLAFHMLSLELNRLPVDVWRTLEKKVGACSSQEISVRLHQKISSFAFEVFFVLSFYLVWKLLQVLLLDIHLEFLKLWWSLIQMIIFDIRGFQCGEDVSFKSLCHVTQLSLHGTVPMILDSVISSTLKDLSDLSPFVFKLSMKHE